MSTVCLSVAIAWDVVLAWLATSRMSNCFHHDSKLVPRPLASQVALHDLLCKYGGVLRVPPTADALLQLESPESAIVFDTCTYTRASLQATVTNAPNSNYYDADSSWPVLLPLDPAVLLLYSCGAARNRTVESDEAFDVVFVALCHSLGVDIPDVHHRRQSATELKSVEVHPFTVLTLTADGLHKGKVAQPELHALLLAFGGAILVLTRCLFVNPMISCMCTRYANTRQHRKVIRTRKFQLAL
jgi:hypothetical protein